MITRRTQALIAAVVLTWTPQSSAADERVAADAKAVLTKFCFDCHGGPNDVGEDLNVLDIQTLRKRPDSAKKKAYVVPGRPAESLIWDYVGLPRAGKFRMPKDEAPQPSAEERSTLERWIADGAEFPKAVGRRPIPARSTTAAIHKHVSSLPRADQPYHRYILLDHLYNNAGVDDDLLRVYRAAVSKLVNSLSWQSTIVVPEVLEGTEKTVMVLDLRKLGWELDDWKSVAKSYPYGVTHPDDVPLHDLEREVARLTGVRLPAFRADWFVASVSRPPHYERLLRLPETLGELEAKLSVDLPRNFSRDTLRRGGMVTSGVSRHNRLVERHPTPYGAYWRSYDFASSTERGNLLLFPLGPKFNGNPFMDRAFEQAGGEVIFHLPNGLQGYMLARADDARLDAPAPVAIVRDRDETSGTPEVVNGVSCIACHQFGMKTFTDEVRNYPAVFGEMAEKLNRLYAPKAEMDGLLALDEKKFLDALDLAVGPFLRGPGVEKKSVRDLILFEPIGRVATLYKTDLSPAAVAAELESPDIEAVRAAVGGDRFRELGLGPLLDAKAVKRELWEGKGFSLFHRVSNELGRSRSEIR